MYKLTQKILIVLAMVGFSMAVQADDIDIINKEIPIDSNVLFVMDLSGSMNAELPVPGNPTRLDELKGAFMDVVADPDFDDINIGLSVFSGAAQGFKGGGRAHGISFPISPVLSKKAQDSLSRAGFTHQGISYMPKAGTTNTREYLNLLSTDPAIWEAGGDTPIVDALYEAALYFKGEDVYWGKRTADDIRSAHPSTYLGLLNNGSVLPSCTAATRLSCTKGSCGATEKCANKLVKQVRVDTTGGINCGLINNNRTTCAEGVTSCGTGTNCSLQDIAAENKTCESIYTNIADCLAAPGHTGWESCVKTKPCIASTPGLEGGSVCTAWGVKITCKLPRKRYICDAPDSYKCEYPVEKCTKCPAEFPVVTGNATYVTPIQKKCPANGIILLSDGEPTVNLRPDLVSSKIGAAIANSCNTTGAVNERCGRELAKYLATVDQNSAIPDNQFVNTYTVGLALEQNSTATKFLQDVADNGGGSFVNATSRAELAVAFKRAILAFGKKARSFSAPTYSINPATQLTHGEFVYVPVFDQGAAVAWPGNLKKYKLKDGMLYGLDASSTLVQATDAAGKLILSVKDLWATGFGSDPIKAGGAANLLDPASRTIWTNKGTSLVAMSAVSHTKYGAADNTERDKFIDYIKGEKADGTPRHHMGDIIHSKPIQLAYSKKESVIFVGTNEGYLHAIKSTENLADASDGKELFAFMPNELLKNIKPQYDRALIPEHVYGVDGPMKLWLDDKNKNGIKDKGEDAYLYFGLRRGGQSYYALKLGENIGDKPTLAWQINDKTAGFKNLGFTWSEPTIAKIKHTKLGSLESVLIFGGGYVDDHKGEIVKNTKGSDVYIVDAKTGKKLWSTDKADIDFAVPAKIRTVDVDRNGSVDRLYFGDTGANLWRVDLGGRIKRYDLSESTLTHIAKLGDGDKISGADTRMFFTEPDVAFLKHGGRYALSIAMGSGSRPDPLSDVVDNHFFVLFDENVFNYPAKTPVYTTILMKDLLEAPLSKADSNSLIAKLKVAGSKKGWKMNLNPTTSLTGLTGEKVLSAALTFENKILFSSFGVRGITKVVVNNLDCGLENRNSGRLYVLDLLTGGATLDLSDNKTVKDPEDRSVRLPGGGEIPETPQIVYEGGFTGSDGISPCTNNDCTRIPIIRTGKSLGISLDEKKTKTNKPIPLSKKLPRQYWLDNEQ